MKKYLQKKITVVQFLLSLLFTLICFLLVLYIFFDKKLPKQEVNIPVATNKINVVGANGISKKDTSSLARLQLYLQAIKDSFDIYSGDFGFYLATADSGKIICQYNENENFVPASVMKVVSTGVALSKLGTGYRFPTFLQYEGKIENRILEGNIYIKGSGDPTLGGRVFASTNAEKILSKWVDEIKSLGIDSIHGSIIGDADSHEIEMTPGGWGWEDIENDYGTGLSGLNFYENLYELTLNSKANITKIAPQIPGLKLHNLVVPNSTINKSYVYTLGGPYATERYVLGEIKEPYVGFVPVPNPAELCAFSLYNKLLKSNIKISDSCSTLRKLKNESMYDKKERKTIYTHYSPALADIVNHTNHVSHNFYAESILRALAYKLNGYGTTAGGVRHVYNFMRENKISTTGFYMVDGSGISRFNSFTVKHLGQILLKLSQDKSVFPSFYESLPIAGETGTLRKMAKETLAKGNLRAKSGTMSRVKSYAGYVKDKNGKLLVFAMMANNYDWDQTTMRDKFEELMGLMANLD